MRTHVILSLALAAILSGLRTAQADTFGSGANSFAIEFVTIGNPGNPPDTTGVPGPVGSVPYPFHIGKYENSEQMISKANALGMLGITQNMRGPDKPATLITWHEAARFVNWLNTSTGHMPAYKYVGETFARWVPGDPGFNPNNHFRNSLAAYFLPSVNEWYKAAYYDPALGVYYDFPTGSNMAPLSITSGTAPGTAVFQRLAPADVTRAGGLSPYGTMAQGGNVQEWNDTDLAGFDQPASSLIGRAFRGGDYGLFAADMLSTHANAGVASSEYLQVGFRIASLVPEPTSLTLCGIAFLLFRVQARRLAQRAP